MIIIMLLNFVFYLFFFRFLFQA